MQRMNVNFRVLNESRLLWTMRQYRILLDEVMLELEYYLSDKCPSRAYVYYQLSKNRLEPLVQQYIERIINQYVNEIEQEDQRRKKKSNSGKQVIPELKNDSTVKENRMHDIQYGDTGGMPSPRSIIDKNNRFSCI